MALSNKAWNALRPLAPGAVKQTKPLAIRVGGDDVVADLVASRHLKRVGGQVARTRTSVNAFVLFDVLPADGSSVTGRVAEVESDLTPTAFEHALALLERTGEVEVRGKVRLKIRRAPDTDFAARDVLHERNLYPPFRDWLEQQTRKDPSTVWAAHHVVGDGLGQPRRVGKWARPGVLSIVVATSESGGSTPAVVSTFELKPQSQVNNLAGVYEAVAHQRFAHYSTLIIESPPDASIPAEIRSECRRLGVGLYRLWHAEVERELEAVRQEPAADTMAAFIERSLPAADHERYQELACTTESMRTDAFG